METISKPAYDEEYRTVTFTPLLAAGVTIASAEIIMTDDREETVVTTDMISNVAPYLNTLVLYKLKGGTPVHTYIMDVRIITSTGEKFSEKFLVEIT